MHWCVRRILSLSNIALKKGRKLLVLTAISHKNRGNTIRLRIWGNHSLLTSAISQRKPLLPAGAGRRQGFWGGARRAESEAQPLIAVKWPPSGSVTVTVTVGKLAELVFWGFSNIEEMLKREKKRKASERELRRRLYAEARYTVLPLRPSVPVGDVDRKKPSLGVCKWVGTWGAGSAFLFAGYWAAESQLFPVLPGLGTGQPWDGQETPTGRSGQSPLRFPEGLADVQRTVSLLFQLIFEHHGFKLCRSTWIWIFSQ